MKPGDVKRLFGFPSRSRDDVRSDIAEEFRFHVDMRIEELTQAGVDPENARVQALEEFGDADSGATRCAVDGERLERHRRAARLASELWQDTTVALRQLAAGPGFAVVAILTLALGIGATAAIFSALDAVLLRPLPYPGADRLVEVFEINDTGRRNSVSGGAFLDWRQHQTQFDSLSLVGPVTANLRAAAAPERLTGLEVSHDFLRVFGITPILGSGFLPEHDQPGAFNDVVILTEELWRSRFGSDPSIVGTSVVLDEVPRIVLGILPNRAWIFREAQFLVPAVLMPGTPRSKRSPHWAEVYGRLEPGTTALRADAELKTVKQQLASQYPAFKQNWTVMVEPLHDVLSADRRAILVTLLAAVALVLLIACANVANLLLARACRRQHEMALRRALGATSARLMRQMLTESAILAGLGGVAGAALASWGVKVVGVLMADVVPQAMNPHLDARVLAFAVALSGSTALLFGMVPAWLAARSGNEGALKNGGRTATVSGQRRTQSLLVVAQVALTVVLLSGAGLLLRSLANAAAADPGFDPHQAFAFDLSLPSASYPTAEARLAFSSELLRRLRGLPGVEAAGAGMALPASGGGFGEYLSTPGRPDTDYILGRVDYVSDGYLEALGTRLVRGRRFAASDNHIEGLRVAVVNATAARALFPGENPVGRQLAISGNTWQVIGVVADVVDRRVDLPPRSFAYLPQAFNPYSFAIVLRTSTPAAGLVPAVRQQLEEAGPGVAIANVRTLDESLAKSMAQRRMSLTLFAAFAVGALLLATVGLYGVMAYAVATRRRELCIRMALGAAARDLVRGIVTDGLRLTILGLLVGLGGAMLAGRLLSSQLFRVGSADPVVVMVTTALMVFVAIVACLVPAWDAGRSNPIAALRNE